MNPPLSICAANQERLRLTCNRKKLQIPICAKNRLTVTALNLVLVRAQEAHPQSSHVDSERFGLLGGTSGWSIQGMIVECSVPCAGDSISGRLTTMFGTHSRVLGCDFKAYLRTNLTSIMATTKKILGRTLEKG